MTESPNIINYPKMRFGVMNVLMLSKILKDSHIFGRIHLISFDMRQMMFSLNVRSLKDTLEMRSLSSLMRHAWCLLMRGYVWMMKMSGYELQTSELKENEYREKNTNQSKFKKEIVNLCYKKSLSFKFSWDCKDVI